MTDIVEEKQYIYCVRCSNTCLRNDEDIQKCFGFNKNNQRFKLCAKCRERIKHNRNQPHRKEQQKEYYNSRAEHYKEYRQQRYLNTRDEYLKKVSCEVFGKEICAGQLKRHQNGKWCKTSKDKAMDEPTDV